MTKDDFLQLQELQHNSGLPLMKYLRENGLSYSTYNYWKRKFLAQDSEVPFAQVCLRPSTEVILPSLAGHITLCFPNGVPIFLLIILDIYELKSKFATKLSFIDKRK